ncbi:AAR104Wp [Eremothecium gossypii ATCC 10895]|uniref:AAR104Wp n=1 Tax=Eremothecium gossypii (strain ATCC 10895 / CBS 109.51 / FGSC 9923 / NRRL Y-1056) TaxID=284811 RepID=Q75EH5_EREGS|nr:AAR104Wp [Eremothecium gossypii ATCC 10895]AAS50469.1 AAR104Wp [Eremothecium gossypii ATCC 10895]AEY94755.1 FAAR104Wp [Eremothecium gossypii FDAG1]
MEQALEDLELLVVGDVTRDLFTEAVAQQHLDTGEQLDVSQFLLANNLQYVFIDDLHKQLKQLEQDISNALLNEVKHSYAEYASLCAQFGGKHNSEILDSLQQVRYEVAAFENKLRQLVHVELRSTRDNVESKIEYLKALDTLDTLLQKHVALDSIFQFSARLSRSLEVACQDAPAIDDELVSELLKELYKLLQCAHSILIEFQDLSSPLVTRFRNNYQNNVHVFHSIVSILIDKCSEKSAEFPSMTSTLVAVAKR